MFDLHRSLGRSTLALFALLAGFWGTSFVAIQEGLHYFPPFTFAGIRYLAAGFIILTYAALTVDRWLPRGRDEWLSITVAGVLVFAVYHGLLYLGEQYVSGAVAAVVISLSPVLTVVFAALVLGEGDFDVRTLAGFALGVGGVVVLSQPDLSNLDERYLLGIGLVLAAGAAFALGAVLERPLRTDLPTRAMEGWAMVVGSLVLLGGGAATGESLAAISWTTTAVASLVFLTLGSGVLGFLAYFELLARVGPVDLNLVGYAEPVVATVVAWLLLGQVVSPATLAGFVLVFTGFALVKRDALARKVHALLPARDRGTGAYAGMDD